MGCALFGGGVWPEDRIYHRRCVRCSTVVASMFLHAIYDRQIACPTGFDRWNFFGSIRDPWGRELHKRRPAFQVDWHPLKDREALAFIEGRRVTRQKPTPPRERQWPSRAFDHIDRTRRGTMADADATCNRII